MEQKKRIQGIGLPGLNPEQLICEMEAVDLGDERRNQRLLQLIGTLARTPSTSLAAACDSEAELEGAYRLLRNHKVDWAELMEPHLAATRARAAEAKEVIVVHDTSTFRLSEAAELDSWIQTGKKGFFAHLSLALDGREARKPLGVMGMELVFRKQRQRRTKNKNGRRMNGAETAKLKGKEFDRWWRLIQGTGQRLADLKVVHVMDRECDSYELLANLHHENHSYVIRWCKDRCAKFSDNPEADWEKVRALLARAKSTKMVREIHVGARRAKTAPRANRATPQRDSRTARLRVACCSLDLKRPVYLSKETCPAAISVNVVHVYEPSPPAGEEPIEWVLLSNLPIRNITHVERIIDIYRQRRVIEEYFKAIKSGCTPQIIRPTWLDYADERNGKIPKLG